MRGDGFKERSSDQYYLTDSEDEYYPRKVSGNRVPAGGSGGVARGSQPGQSHRRPKPRRYSDMVSSGDEFDEYDDDTEFGRAANESERRARRQVTSLFLASDLSFCHHKVDFFQPNFA